MSSQFSLLRTRRFGPFFCTQFLGAFNDNLFKNALVVLITFQAAQWTTLSPGLLANLAAAVFILPFFLFSATAGQLADKYDKARLARLVKGLEIAITVIAAFGFLTHHLILLFICLFLLGLHSTLFGPVKYAILPQHLAADELVGGNALIEAGTFVAILLGTIAGGLLSGLEDGRLWIAGGCFLTALAGYATSRGIPPAPPPAPELKINPNPIGETLRNLGYAREDRTVFLSILGISWFWLYGALFLAQFPLYAKVILGGDEASVTLLLCAFTLGIGVGSLLCERLSARQIEIGLVPFGSFGLTVFGLDLAFAGPATPLPGPLPLGILIAAPGTLHVLFDLVAIGLFGGFFIVPLYALVQLRSPVAQRARVIAANNILNALFMVVGSLIAGGLLAAGLSIPALFGFAALCNAVVAVIIYGLVPEFLVRFLAWLLVHTVYRLEARGIERIPEDGAALLVANRISTVDALVIAAACRRPIRFALAREGERSALMSFFYRSNGAFLAPGEEFAAEIGAALAAGELVCLFPEAQRTADGALGDFAPQFADVIRSSPAPVLPVALSGLWGSAFSRHPAGMLRLGRRVRVAVGPALGPTPDPEAVREALRASGATTA